MKFTIALSLLAMLTAAECRALAPVIEVDTVNATSPSPLANCIITSYRGDDCTGGIIAYDYVVDGCRSCESFSGAHSFGLGQGCPSGTFFANVGGCNNRGDQFKIGFSGPGCHHVNTGEDWQSGNPCFN